MRISDLFESAPGKKGITRVTDAKQWLENIKYNIDNNNTDAIPANDLELYNSLKALSKKFGGKTTIINVLQHM